jgi:hypothetical protein
MATLLHSSRNATSFPLANYLTLPEVRSPQTHGTYTPRPFCFLPATGILPMAYSVDRSCSERVSCRLLYRLSSSLIASKMTSRRRNNHASESSTYALLMRGIKE